MADLSSLVFHSNGRNCIQLGALVIAIPKLEIKPFFTLVQCPVAAF